MAKQQTEKSRYPSIYGGADCFVTGAQYIIELIAQKYGKLKKIDLPLKFWKEEKWASFYKRWLRQTHKILKDYDERAVIRALKSKESGLRWSLHTPFLLDLIKREQEKLNNEQKPIKNEELTQRKNIDGVGRQHELSKGLKDILSLDE